MLTLYCLFSFPQSLTVSQSLFSFFSSPFITSHYHLFTNDSSLFFREVCNLKITTFISDCYPKLKYSSHPCKTNLSLSPRLKAWNLLFPSLSQVLLNLFLLKSLSHQTLPSFFSLPPPSPSIMHGLWMPVA